MFHLNSLLRSYLISLINRRGRLLLFFSLLKGATIRGRRLFRILLIVSVPLKKIKNHIKLLNIHFLSVPNLVPWLIQYFNNLCQYPRRQSLNRRHWSILLDQTPFHWQGADKRKRRWQKKLQGGGGGLFEGGDYLNISVKGRRLIEGRLLFEKMR